MEEEFDGFFNINQLLMEQKTDELHQTNMQEEANNTTSLSDSTESSNQQQTESAESEDSETEAEPNGQQQGDVVDVRSKKLGTIGKKPKEYSDEWLMSVPLYKRTTNRSYGAALNVNHVLIHMLKKKGRLRAITATNHPALSDNHKIARLKWVLQHIEPVPTEGDPSCMDLQHYIHINEKWFYLNLETRTFYLTPNEEVPYRAQQSKSFKLKAMFMGMIGKPLYAQDGTLLHSGKYGLFPFVKKQMAKKKRKNREAGTMETKAIQSVNRDAIREMILNKIIPTIHAEWPQQLSKNIVIQWDNARPHQVPNDEEFVAATKANGFNIQFSFPKNLDELIKKVAEAFEVFDPTLNRYTWITLQSCMIKVLEKQGGNNFNPPHMSKARQAREGTLGDILKVSRELIADTVNYPNTLFVPTTGPQPKTEDMEVDAD
ncbi:uncharacterized protein LOC110715154 [Chenopodium quinoa]|uniref:uncharacterized protein LOC110715154 n=1 Tax=Chenopodium quinoa TaxID=63459 RepID=UPI000B798DE7|nr:uncharacterized protein LOC110715154 [Chenopodium quinoa]